MHSLPSLLYKLRHDALRQVEQQIDALAAGSFSVTVHMWKEAEGDIAAIIFH